MDLIARSISYVSTEKTPDALAATTIIYKPGKTMHNIGICQALGRITGLARPDLERRVFATKELIYNYIYYNYNQQQYIKEIIENEGIVTSEIMNKIKLNFKLTRPLDRPKLNLKPQFTQQEQVQEQKDDNRMHQLINLWWGANTIISKILQFVYESKNGVSESALKQLLSNIGSTNPNEMYNELIRSGRGYNLVFKRQNNITSLYQEAIDYINSIM